jgi:hypothetical protein
MNSIARLVIHSYSKLLNLYPRRFRDEFAEEMQEVFRDSLDEAIKRGWFAFAITCTRELIGLPFNIIKEFWREFQRKETIMLGEKPTTTGQVMGGTLPFFLFGLFMIMWELPISLSESNWFLSVAGSVFSGLLILPAIGFGIGWVQHFPRWSYPYAGMALIMALYIQNVTTPGLSFFGIPIFGQEPWGWRAWVPLAAAFMIALAVSRSRKPFTSFFTNLWKDWTIPSYLMVGALPLLLMIVFDEMDRMYSLYFMLAFAVLLVSMVILYLRGQTTWQRVLALTLGVGVIIFPAVLGTNFYWQGQDGISLSGARSALLFAGKVSLVMLLPAWLELLRRSMARLRTA